MGARIWPCAAVPLLGDLKELLILQSGAMQICLYLETCLPHAAGEVQLSAGGFAPVFTEPTPLRLVMFPIDSCLYRISMLMFCLVPLRVRCSKVFVQTPPGKRKGPPALPCSSLTAWEHLAEGMVPPELPSTSSGSPQTQEVTF